MKKNLKILNILFFYICCFSIALLMCYLIYLLYPTNGLSLTETIIQSTQEKFITFVPLSGLIALLLCIFNFEKQYFFRKLFLCTIFSIFILAMAIFLINYFGNFLGRGIYSFLEECFWILVLSSFNFLLFINILMPIFYIIQYFGKTIFNFKKKLISCIFGMVGLFLMWAFFINPYYIIYQAGKATYNHPYCIMVSYQKQINLINYKPAEHIYNFFALSQKTPYEAYHQDNHGIKQYKYHTILISINEKNNKISYWNWSHKRQNFEPISEKNCILYIDGTYDRLSVHNDVKCNMKCPKNYQQDIFIKFLNKITQ